MCLPAKSERISEKCRICRHCNSHFRVWQIYVETLLGWGGYTEYTAPHLSFINRFYVQAAYLTHFSFRCCSVQMARRGGVSPPPTPLPPLLG
jgi:hypothetical protein